MLCRNFSAAFLLTAFSSALAAENHYPVIELEGTEPPTLTEPSLVPLPEIVVYGDQLQRQFGDSDASVEVITVDQLQRASAVTMKDIASQMANVTSAGGDRELSIRGVPQGGLGGEGETISVLLDGLALPARAAGFAGPTSAWDLEQVEVLRGAQSTSQGRNSIAGMVAMQARRPTPYWDLSTRAGFFSRDGYDIALAGGGPLLENLSFRVSAQDRRDRGDIRNVTLLQDDAGREITRNGRFKLAWEPSDDYSLALNFTAARNDRGDTLHVLSENRVRTERSDVRYEDITRSGALGATQIWDISERWSIESISGVTRSRAVLVIDQGRTEEDLGYSDNILNEEILSQELSLRFDGDRLHFVSGLYLAHSDQYQGTVGHNIVAGGGAALLNGGIDGNGNVTTGALFAESDWDFTENWRLTVGFRVNQERLKRHDVSDVSLALTAPVPGLDLPLNVPLPAATVNLLAAAYPDGIPQNYDVEGDRRFTDVLPKLGLSWQLTDSLRLAATYTEGFRSGGTSVAFFSGQVSEFDPEYTRSGELAVRSQPLAQLHLNANFFYTDWQDQQVLIGESTGFTTITTNAGRSHSYGAELEAVWSYSPAWGLRLSAGWLNTQFDAFENQGEDYAGHRFPYAPKITAALSLDIRELFGMSGSLTAQHVGSYYSDPANTADTFVKQRILLNARAGWWLGQRWQLVFWGRNITGDDNIQGRFVDDETEVHRYGEARSLGLLLEYRI